MKHCTSCGSQLPLVARFCGICGNLVSTTSDTPTGISDFNIVGVMHSDAPTFISDPSHPAIASNQPYGLDATYQRTPEEGEKLQLAPSTEEHDAVMFDSLIWGAQG